MVWRWTWHVLMPLLTVQAVGPDGQAACDELGIEVLPTLQFWRDGQMLWEHRGVMQLEQNIGEGRDLGIASTALARMLEQESRLGKVWGQESAM